MQTFRTTDFHVLLRRRACFRNVSISSPTLRQVSDSLYCTFTRRSKLPSQYSTFIRLEVCLQYNSDMTFRFQWRSLPD